jgi:3-methyladenine DNA glycosylase AlkD
MNALMQRLTREYEAARDPARAGPMSTYVCGQFPFLGIPTPLRRELSRRVIAGVGKPTEAELTEAGLIEVALTEAGLIEVALACWRLPEREYQYFACDWLRRHATVLTPAFVPTARHLVVTKSWWDTVDALAAHVVGVLVARHPALVSTMDEWAGTDELWLVRTAILHQLRYKSRTDADRLFRYCVSHASHQDFFIRKAIGWALREYAKTDPDAVRRFVKEQATLSSLSVREALKNL